MNIFKGLGVPKTIYAVDSELNGRIEVTETGGTRRVKVGKITQSISWDSPVCEKLVWGKVSELLKREVPDLKSVLILGMGGGTMAHLISRALPETSIVSVELDPAMVEIAEKFFDVEAIPNHTIINGDALGVVIEPQKHGLRKDSFGALVVDIYVGEDYPDLGDTGNFMAALRNMVSPGGLVIFNRIYLNHHQADVDSFKDQVEDFFQDVKEEIVAGYTNSDNILIYGRV
jgi:spermidine synthase